MVSFTSCEITRWDDVPVDYTDVFYFRPTSDDVEEFGYTIYPETSVLITWGTEYYISAYNEIYDYVDSSDENGYYVTFREIRYVDAEGNVPGYDADDEDVADFTIQKSYYYVIDTDIYGRGTYSITDEEGNSAILDSDGETILNSDGEPEQYMLMEIKQKTLEQK